MELRSFLTYEGILSLVEGMAQNTLQLAEQRHFSDLALIGIRTGGVYIAEELRHTLNINETLGTLDIAFYRDDFSQIGLNPEVKPSHIPFDVDDRNILLVDDVVHTGRTIRAALNEIFDYGRPASVTLAALVDRNGRELPIKADIIGVNVTLAHDERIKLVVDKELELVIGTYK